MDSIRNSIGHPAGYIFAILFETRLDLDNCFLRILDQDVCLMSANFPKSLSDSISEYVTNDVFFYGLYCIRPCKK